MLTESVDVVIDDCEWSVDYRDKTDRSRSKLNDVRDRRSTSQQRFARDVRNTVGGRGHASLSSGVHRRCNKRSLHAAKT